MPHPRLVFSVLLVIGSLPVAGQDLSPDDFHIEVTASAWNAGVNGTVQALGLPVALHNDLALQESWTFFGKLVFKPGRRHRINIEGSPYSFTGLNTLSRNVTFNGRTYSVQETVSSGADLAYFFGGYQFDLVSRPRGHLGLEAGGTYLDATGTIRGFNTGLAAVREQKIGLPLAGAEFRVFLLPHRRLLNINGEAKGMAFGGYGDFFQGVGKVGVGLRWLAIEAGYQYLNADIHENRSVNPAGIAPVISGPIFALQFRR